MSTAAAPTRMLPAWHVPMRARDQDESHRPSTPLELLFDLTFVVAVSFLVEQLVESLIEGHVGDGVLTFLMVFFAIWWAWMNFTWFASAYDCDDGPYRLLTMVQMGGVLVLAAGVAAAFQDQQFATITVGYVIMRVALVLQWLRAAKADPIHRAAATKYAVGIAIVQVGWLLRLLLPPSLGLASFIILALAEMIVPIWSERGAMTTWHPHHIAERYGLFTIILLGESVMASTQAVAASRTASGVSPELALVAFSGLVLLFGIWWVYFLEPTGEHLKNRRDLSFFWGYGHYAIFAALAAIGAGLEVSVEAVTSHGSAPAVESGSESVLSHLELSSVAVAYTVAIPVGIFLFMLWALNAPLADRSSIPPSQLLTTVVIVLLVPVTALWWSPSWSLLLIACAVAGLITSRYLSDRENQTAEMVGDQVS